MPINGTVDRDVLARIRMECVEMPDLRLTSRQASRLWNLDEAACDAILTALIQDHFLSQTADGSYVVASAQLVSARDPSPAMATNPVAAAEAERLHVGDASLHGHSVMTEQVAGWQWVRLAYVGSPNYLVLLKVSPTADEHDAVRALEWWLLSPGREDGDVLEVF